MHRLIIVILVTLATSACASEEYGFVARLGNDTTSIERIIRTRSKIVSDLVQQSPQLIRIHWEADLNRDGSLRHWTMRKTFLQHAVNEPADAEYAADFDNGAVHVKQRVGTEAKSYDMSDVLPVTVPWEAFAYGLYELLFEAAAKQSGDSIPIRQYMTGFGNWAGRGVVRKQSDSTMTLTTAVFPGPVSRVSTGADECYPTRERARPTSRKSNASKIDPTSTRSLHVSPRVKTPRQPDR